MIGIELFAGAGGMSLGATMAGVKVKIAVEIKPSTASTFKANHPGTVVLQKDIREVVITNWTLQFIITTWFSLVARPVKVFRLLTKGRAPERTAITGCFASFCVC